MRNEKILILSGFIFIFIISWLLPNYFFPSDILNYLPSFSQEKWEKPHNSLLADPLYQFEPWRNFAKERILKGELPIWNNQNANGVPFFANPQVAVLYPLNVIYYVFPVKVALWMIPLLKLYLFAVFTYLYLRSLKCLKSISFIGAATATFAAFPITWLLWPHTNVFIFFPIILYLTEKIYERKTLHHRLYVILSFAYLFMILGGHPGTIIHLTTIHLLYILFRFWGEKRRMLPLYASIVLGFLLSALQLVPFLEYLSQSVAFEKRFFANPNVFLPFISIVMNFFPFAFGAPHKEFYKQFSSTANFQELIAGYVGPAVLLLTIIGVYKFRKDKMVQIWGFIICMTFLIAYKVWPFWLIIKLPLLNAIGSTRLIGFGAFGFAVLFALILQKLIDSKKVISIKYFSNFVVLSTGVFFLFLFGEDLVSGIIVKRLPEKIANFYPFLEKHISSQFFSTLLFFGLLLFALTKKREKRSLLFIFLLIPLFMQNIFLFWNYNTITQANQFYPQKPIIQKLQSSPYGSILEVGNPNFPPNLNMQYNLIQAENDDAIGLKSFHKEFDRLFPVRNQWKKVDEVELSSLQKFGIRYIISDYDINLKKVGVQKKYEKILQPITSSVEIRVPFTALYSNLAQIRLLTANFNRQNTCKLEIGIFDKSTKSFFPKQNIACYDIRDFMYYTISFSNIKLKVGNAYEIVIKSPDATKQNSIALWGSNSGKPYLEVLYEVSKPTFALLWNRKSVYLWEVSNVKDVNMNGVYSIPASFIIGLFLSFVTFVGLLFYLIRHELHFIKRKTLIYHIVAGSLSLFIGLIVFVLINSFLIPKTLPLPKTNAINWLVTHKHSITLDYIRFGLFIFIIPASIVIGWIVLIWRRKR